VSDFRQIFRGARRKTALTFSLLFVLIHVICHAGSIRDVSQSVEKVLSIEPPIQFAILGDSRDGKKTYAQLLQKILGRKPHFIIHLGDMVSRPSEEEWKEFFEISEAIDIPFFPAIGNHEVADTSRGEGIYRKQFHLPGDKTYYSFRAADTLFVILDSEKGRGQILEEQWMWLEETLSPSKEKFKLTFLHRPLFLPTDSFKLGKVMDKYPFARDNLHGFFKRTKVKAVFAGDDHRYYRMENDQILYIITGGGGAPIYAPKDRGGYFHYVWVSLQKRGLEGEVVDLKGQVRDRFKIKWDERR